MNNEPQTDPESNNKVLAVRPQEHTIQPPNGSSVAKPEQTAQQSTPRVDTKTIYPEPVAAQVAPDAAQQFATKTMQEKSQEANQRLSMRLKSLLIVGVLLSLAAAINLAAALTGLDLTKTISLVIVAASLVGLGMSVYLLFARDHHTAAFVLKIFLVLQALSVFSNLANPIGLAISISMLGLIWYAYARVKNSRYY